MSKRNQVVKEITDILQLADTLAGLVCLLRINRKMNDLIDSQRELSEITDSWRTKNALKKLKVEPERNISDISTSDLIKYEELKRKYVEENEKKGVVVDNLNDRFTDELLARSEAINRKQNI